MSLEEFVASLIFGYVLVVARIGSAMLFLPAFGETQIPLRARLSFALVLCLALYPIVPTAGIAPQAPAEMFVLLASEVTVGLWIGLVARVLLSAMQFAGYQVGQVSGLANAFGPSLGSFEGATLVASLLIIGSVALIFITDTHHIILRGLIESYVVFPPGPQITGDFAQQMVKAGSHSLYIGTAIAAPFFVMGVILNLGMGLANRMMPQLPVFFVAAAILIAVGLLIFSVAIPSMIEFFLSDFITWFGTFRF
ncbi:MAG: flagellar biosynthetic protein FliR [Cognatishimia sp.]